MDTYELITILETGLNNSDLRQQILATLSVLRENNNINITAHQAGGSSTSHFLGIYRTRQKHLAKRGIVIPGFDETILSLSKCESERLNLITVNAGDKTITIFITSSKTVAGCYF